MRNNFNGECVICGEETNSPEYDYCYDCYYDMKDKKDEIEFMSKKELIKLFNDTLQNPNQKNHQKNMVLLYAIKELSIDKFNDYELCEDLEQLIYNYNETDDYRLNFETKYRCDDGHYVRSKAEQIIDNWLYYHNFVHAYEKQLTINNKNYIPDFYIPKLNLYLEYWGLNDYEYNQKRKEKEKIYTNSKIKFIGIEENNLKNIDDFLEKQLK